MKVRISFWPLVIALGLGVLSIFDVHYRVIMTISIFLYLIWSFRDVVKAWRSGAFEADLFEDATDLAGTFIITNLLYLIHYGFHVNTLTAWTVYKWLWGVSWAGAGALAVSTFLLGFGFALWLLRREL